MRQWGWAGLLMLAMAGTAQAQTATPPANAGSEDLRQLVEATRAAAQAARENVDYARVVPDILTQILAKLDKIEDKLARIEEAQKAAAKRK